MGVFLFDQFTLLHAAVGVIFYFWGVSLPVWLVLHTLFEWLENTAPGRHVINRYIRAWPGGKPEADTLRNVLGDTLGAVLGWAVAYHVDHYGGEHHWYPLYGRGKNRAVNK